MKIWYIVRGLGLKYELDRTITNPIHCHYRYFPKTNRKYDSMNVVSIHDKFLMDALISCGVILDDNHRHVLWPTFEPCAPDKENPRMEVTVAVLNGQALPSLRTPLHRLCRLLHLCIRTFAPPISVRELLWPKKRIFRVGPILIIYHPPPKGNIILLWDWGRI